MTTVQRWLDDYVTAWRSNAARTDRRPLLRGRGLPLPAVRRRRPCRRRAPGRWSTPGSREPDDPGSWEAAYEVYAVDGDRAVATGYSRYLATDEAPQKDVAQLLPAPLRRRRPVRRVHRVLHGGATRRDRDRPGRRPARSVVAGSARRCSSPRLALVIVGAAVAASLPSGPAGPADADLVPVDGRGGGAVAGDGGRGSRLRRRLRRDAPAVRRRRHRPRLAATLAGPRVLGDRLRWAPRLASTLTKLVFGRERPPLPLAVEATSSFPSGHSKTAVVVTLGLVLLFTVPGRGRRWLSAAAVAYSLVMAWSRTYLRVHWLTDVVGGLALGTVVTLAVLLAVRPLELERIGHRSGSQEPHARRPPASPRELRRLHTAPVGGSLGSLRAGRVRRALRLGGPSASGRSQPIATPPAGRNLRFAHPLEKARVHGDGRLPGEP